MTKAERIYTNTYYECARHIATWGVEYNPDGTIVGYTTLIHAPDEFICKRTINAVQNILDSKIKQCNVMEKIDPGWSERHQNHLQILDMVRVTINNAARKIECFT